LNELLIILPISLLFLTAAILTGLQILKLKSGSTWLVSAILAFVVWVIVMLMRFRIPETLIFGSSKSIITLPFQYILLLDKISWPYAWGLSASLLALILVSATQLSSSLSNRPDRWAWPINLVFGGLGLLAVFSGNLYTMILSWAAIDLIWLFLMLSKAHDHQVALITFTIRAFGLFLAINASYTRPLGEPIIFPIINAPINTLLFMSALVRILSIGWSRKLIGQSDQNQTNSPFIDIVVAATALITVTRSATGLDMRLIQTIIVLTGAIGVICGIAWLLLAKERSNSSFWLVGVSTLAAAAAAQGETQASLAWGIVLLLPGSFLLYYLAKFRFFIVLLVTAVIGISTLPFTPAWQGIRLYPLPGEILGHSVGWIVLLITQTMLTAGFIRSLLQPRESVSGAERWIWSIYPIGLAILLLTQIMIFIFGLPGLANDLQAFPPLTLAWANLAILILTVSGLWISRTPSERLERIRVRLTTITLYESIFRTMRGVFRFISILVHFVNHILEGEGGIIWTLLILILLFALFYQFGIGI